MTNQQATQYAKTHKMSKAHVLRFKVITPQQFPENEEIENRRIENKKDPDFCVYVGNLPYSISKEKIREIFQKYGKVEQVNLPIDKETHKPKGYAFVWFSSIDSAKKAINDLNEDYFEGRKIYVREYRSRAIMNNNSPD
jgi:RNA recognition motif-containing protein